MAQTETNRSFFRSYWKGLLIGFLFGTFGLWLLAMLSLLSQFFEALGSVLFGPGKALSAVLFGASGSDGAVALLMLFNGVFYAIVGFLMQFAYRRTR